MERRFFCLSSTSEVEARFVSPRMPNDEVVSVRVRFLFDLVSYCDVRAQPNPFVTDRDKCVLVERAMVRVLWWTKIEWLQDW